MPKMRYDGTNDCLVQISATLSEPAQTAVDHYEECQEHRLIVELRSIDSLHQC